MVIGLLALLLSIFCSSLTPGALLELNWLLVHARPLHWPVMPLFVLNSTSKAAYQRLKGCGESLRMQIQIMPLLLVSWLDITKFRKAWLQDLKSLHTTDTAVVVAVRESIFAMSNAYQAVFALSMPNSQNAINNLQLAVNMARRLMKTCWSGIRGISFAKTTNFHSASHIGSIARLYGLARLVTCATGECMHGILRRTTAHSNHKHIEKDMLTTHNVRQAIIFLVSGGLDHIHNVNHLYSPSLLTSLRTDPIWQKMVQNSGTTASYVTGANTSRDDLPPPGSSPPPTIRLSGPLDIGSDSDTVYYSMVTIPNREKFASKIALGEWYVATGFDTPTPDLLYVRVDAIFTQGVNVFCTVQPLSKTDTQHGPTGLSIYTPGYAPGNIHVSRVQRPAHVVPLCANGANCNVVEITPKPRPFTHDCCALRGQHAPTTSYIVSTFFVK